MNLLGELSGVELEVNSNVHPRGMTVKYRTPLIAHLTFTMCTVSSVGLERVATNDEVVGSIPTPCTTYQKCGRFWPSGRPSALKPDTAPERDDSSTL